MTKLPKLAPVMVSGANGFLGLHLVNLLLKNGYTVHATVRDANDPSKTGPVEKLAANNNGSGGTLKLFSSNLLQEGSFHAAMDGCQVVYHTASPFLISGVTNPLQQVLEPALQGTKHVLEAVNETDSVQRVVLTSSVASTRVAGQVPKNGVSFTEEDWNESTVDETSDARLVYSYSKAAAERLVWDYVQRQNRWDLVALNPALVLGPTLSSSVTSESFAILKACLQGKAKNAALNVVDVRDVVQAHFVAGTLPAASGRHFLCRDVVEIKEICNIIADLFPGEYPPCDFDDGPVDMFQIDSSKSREKLNIEYQSLNDMIADTVKSYEEVVGFNKSSY